MATTISKLSASSLESALGSRRLLVVGGTAGLGKAASVAALKRGAQVTVVGRRAPDAALGGAKFVKKDLSLLKNAVQLAEEVNLEEVDTILLTTGIISAPQRQVSPEGLELDLAISYLSRYAFMRTVLSKEFGKNRADKSVKPRVFVMGFPGSNQEATLDDFNSEKKYGVLSAHSNTVVGNEALVSHLNTAFQGRVNVYGVNPGIVKTEIRDNLLGKGSWTSSVIETVIGWVTPTPEQYAEDTLIHLLVSPELENRSGALLSPKRALMQPSKFLTVPSNFSKIMSESERLTEFALASHAKL
jgi:NAD(P)-dependent dehydrogenase (short-subunit alcohol dehydrogenase family)